MSTVDVDEGKLHPYGGGQKDAKKQKCQEPKQPRNNPQIARPY